jgi:hypothetical protein
MERIPASWVCLFVVGLFAWGFGFLWDFVVVGFFGFF